jgi:hypothetical protein
LNPVDRNGYFNFLLRQTPTARSSQIKKIVIATIPFTGARIDKKETPSKVKLVFIVHLIVM